MKKHILLMIIATALSLQCYGTKEAPKNYYFQWWTKHICGQMNTKDFYGRYSVKKQSKFCYCINKTYTNSNPNANTVSKLLTKKEIIAALYCSQP